MLSLTVELFPFSEKKEMFGRSQQAIFVPEFTDPRSRENKP
jgi:hypothetical protein